MHFKLALVSFFYKTIKLHETAFVLEHGIWSNLHPYFWDMVTQIELQNKILFPLR